MTMEQPQFENPEIEPVIDRVVEHEVEIENQFEKRRTPTELKMEIQRAFLAFRFAPDDEAGIMEWITSKDHNAERFERAFKSLYLEHPEDLGAMWDKSQDAILETIAERMPAVQIEVEHKKAA
jgi:hypothetical protein